MVYRSYPRRLIVLIREGYDTYLNTSAMIDTIHDKMHDCIQLRNLTKLVWNL